MAKKKEEEFVSALAVDFNKVDMNNENAMWTDEMTKSCFNQQPGLPSSGTSGSGSNVIKNNGITNKRSKSSMFQNRFR